jgi:hypothetical protein
MQGRGFAHPKAATPCPPQNVLVQVKESLFGFLNKAERDLGVTSQLHGNAGNQLVLPREPGSICSFVP